MEVLKTTSPTDKPDIPMELPQKRLPSSKASKAGCWLKNYSPNTISLVKIHPETIGADVKTGRPYGHPVFDLCVRCGPGELYSNQASSETKNL